MKSSDANQVVIRLKNGEFWRFYSKKGQGIYYRKLNQDGQWGAPIELATGVNEEFSACIDNQDTLHLICLGKKGELCYMRYNGRTWSEQTVGRYEPMRYIIRYPSIVVIGNTVHILIMVGTSFNIGLWGIHHYQWDGYTWTSKDVCKFTGGRNPHPFLADSYHNNLHILYRALYTNNKFQILHCRFHQESGIWSTPTDITGSQSDCMSPSLLLEDKKLHLVWLSVESNISRVAYKNTPLNPYSQPTSGKTVYLSPEGYSCSSPQIYMVENLIWCTWYQNDTLYASSSADGGMTWSPPKAVNWPTGIAEYTIRYSSNYQPEKEKVRLHSASAHFNNGISIPMVEITQAYVPAKEPEKEHEFKEVSLEESREEESKVQKQEDTEPPADEKFRLILDELQRLREENQEGTERLMESLSKIQELEKQMARLSEKVQKLLIESEETKNEVIRLQEKGFIRSIFRSHRG